MWPNPQETADLVTFTKEILHGKLHFSCSVKYESCTMWYEECAMHYVVCGWGRGSNMIISPCINCNKCILIYLVVGTVRYYKLMSENIALLKTFFHFMIYLTHFVHTLLYISIVFSINICWQKLERIRKYEKVGTKTIW